MNSYLSSAVIENVIMDAFTRHEACSPDRAVPLSLAKLDGDGVAEHIAELREKGVLKVCDDGNYWLDLRARRSYIRRRLVIYLLAVGIGLTIGIVLLVTDSIAP